MPSTARQLRQPPTIEAIGRVLYFADESKAQQNAINVVTAYKRKADKVHLVNSSALNRTVIGGIMEWREVALYRQKVLI